MRLAMRLVCNSLYRTARN